MRAQSAPVLKHVGIVAIDGVFASTLMQAKDFFHMASLRHGKQQGLGLQPAFRTRILSPDGQPVRSFSGDSIAVDGPLAACDIVVLPAFWGDFDALERRYPQIVPWLRRSHAEGTALCGEATGVFWLAQAGLLDGKEATTYWRFYREFAERFPNVLLNQEKHLTDADDLFCASGVTSACDLYIYLIERFCGGSVAQAVARDTLYEVQRSYTPGRIGFGGQKLHHDPTILQIQQWLEDHFADKFRFEDVARDHGMSIRTSCGASRPLPATSRCTICSDCGSRPPRACSRARARASRRSATRSATTTPASSPACSASTPNSLPTITVASSCRRKAEPDIAGPARTASAPALSLQNLG